MCEVLKRRKSHACSEVTAQPTMITKNTTSLGTIISLATLLIELTSAAWVSYPLTTNYEPVSLKIGFYISEGNVTTETQATDYTDSTEIYGFDPDDDDERVIFVDTIDPNMEQVIVDESTEIIDPLSYSNPATESDVSSSAVSSPNTDIRDELDPENPSIDEAGEENLTISEPSDLDEPITPESNESDDLTTNKPASAASGQKPVADVRVTDLLGRPQRPVPDIPGRQINMVTLDLPFTRRRDPNRGEAVRHVRVITGYTAFKEPLDIWLASFSGGPPHDRIECYFTMVPIEDMPELYHSGAPSSDDIMSGRVTERFTPGDWSFSVKRATGVGCISWVPREERKGWWGRRRSG